MRAFQHGKDCWHYKIFGLYHSARRRRIFKPKQLLFLFMARSSQRKIERTIQQLGLSEDEAIAYLKNSRNKRPEVKQHSHDFGTSHIKVIFTADWHLGNKCARLDLVEVLFEYARREKVECIYNAGDITDGMYTNRPGHIYELCDIGYDAQLKRAVEVCNASPVPVFAITGNHDYTHMRNAGADIGSAVEAASKQYHNLGIDEANVVLNKKVTLKLIHPGRGSAYALSYHGQKLVESFEGGKKPNIVVEGHYHKLLQMFYRNVHFFDAGTLCDQTKFMRSMNLAAHRGFWIADIHFNNKGVEKLVTQLVAFYD